MDNEILITGEFFDAGLPACVIIPGMLVIWDLVPDRMDWLGLTQTSIKKMGILPF